jgi:7-cyano-7-deazaguanine synthase
VPARTGPTIPGVFGGIVVDVPDMPSVPHQPETGLLLSGGIDSAVLLSQLLDRGWSVVPFYVRTGCVWEANELESARQFLAKLKQQALRGLRELVVLDMPLGDLYGDHWSFSGADVPDEHTPDEAVYLPGHNPLLLLKPAMWCRMHGIEHLALATLSNNPFSDATPAFFARFEEMLHEAMGGRVQVARPFEQLTKNQVLEMGRQLPLELTFSCLAPVDGLHCGHCNKCAERRRGFVEVGLNDPTEYEVARGLGLGARGLGDSVRHH